MTASATRRALLGTAAAALAPSAFPDRPLQSFAAAMRTQAVKPEPSTPEALAALQQSERDAYGAVVRALNITLDGA